MLQEAIRQELKHSPHLLTHTDSECRVYNNRKDYYVAVTDIDASLPLIVSLQRITREPHDYELYRKVERLVNDYNGEHRKELTLVG